MRTLAARCIWGPVLTISYCLRYAKLYGGERARGGSCESAHRLSEDGVPVTRNDLPGFKGRPDVLRDLLVWDVLADLRTHLLDPSEDLLIGETTTN